MHIVEIPSFFTPYGGEFCLEQSKALKTQGHDVRILSNVQISIKRSWKEFFFLPYTTQHYQTDGIPVTRHFMRGIPKVIRPNVNRWVDQVRRMFADYVNQYGKPDILHAHCCKWAGYAAMLLSEEYHLPYIITEHLSSKLFQDELGDGKDCWQVPLLKEAYRKAQRVIVVAEELVDDLEPLFGRDYQWQFISNTIDTDFFYYQERKPHKDRNFRYCCVAHFTPLKGYDVLIAAFEQLHERYPKTELHLAGLGLDSPAFQEMIRATKDPASIVVHGVLDKEGVRGLLYNSDVCVLASRSEVQPLSMMEAMSTGCVAIATSCIPKTLCQAGCRVVPIDDVSALSKEMEQAMHASVKEGVENSRNIKVLASPTAVGKQLSDVMKEVVSVFSL